ncbi:unnamed protein product [Porites evermanni]|uniref:Protein kinase domain-containing protein n=1 Tax=Porites evermanni TaxID=104178 RepID=A0ABN8REX3_9CNID|nr:unnamed protein product [Porites evermanni]
MTIANEEYNESLKDLLSTLHFGFYSSLKVNRALLGDKRFESSDVIEFSRGGLQVLVELTFKEAVSTEYVIAALKKAAESKTLATFQIKSSSIITTRENNFIETTETTAGTSSMSTVEVCSGCECNSTILKASIGVLAVVIIVLILHIIWLHIKGIRMTRSYKEAIAKKGSNDNGMEMLDCYSGHNASEENKSHAPSSVEYVKTPLDLNTESRSKDLAENQTTNTISQYVTWCPSTFSFEIPRENVVIEKIIGKGAFGQVAKATVIGLRGRTQATLVAVKILKGYAPKSDRKDLLSELEVMKTLNPHPHAIKLLGCITELEPLRVLIEYVPYGDLLGYLRKSRGLNDTYYNDPDIKPRTSLMPQQLMKFAWQIADGMSYLSTRSVKSRGLNDTYYNDPDIKPRTSLMPQQLMKFAWQIADGMSYLSTRSVTKLLLRKLRAYCKLFSRPRRSYTRGGLPKAWFSLKHKHNHKKNGQVRSSCACAYDYIVAFTSENGVDISTSKNTRTWTNRRPL